MDVVDRDLWLAEAGAFNLGPGKIYLLGDANLDGVVDGQDFILSIYNCIQINISVYQKFLLIKCIAIT